MTALTALIMDYHGDGLAGSPPGEVEKRAGPGQTTPGGAEEMEHLGSPGQVQATSTE